VQNWDTLMRAFMMEYYSSGTTEGPIRRTREGGLNGSR
jgi:hypothetical protein